MVGELILLLLHPLLLVLQSVSNLLKILLKANVVSELRLLRTLIRLGVELLLLLHSSKVRLLLLHWCRLVSDVVCHLLYLLDLELELLGHLIVFVLDGKVLFVVHADQLVAYDLQSVDYLLDLLALVEIFLSKGFRLLSF